MSMSVKMTEKIGKLLAKAERTDNDHEREAFSRQAERLMLKWGIEEAMARAASGGEVKPEKVVTEMIDYSSVGSTYSKGVVLSMHSILRGMGLDGYHGAWTRLYIVGHESDVERAKMLLNSLLLQMISSRDVWWKEMRKDPAYRFMSEHERWRLRMDFMVSFGSAVSSRLRQMNQEETEAAEEAQAGTTLVLRNRRAEVADAMSQAGVRKGRPVNFGGSVAGAEAGARANLGEKGLGGTRAALR